MAQPMYDFAAAPHPLLTSPTLYVADVTKRVKWQHLEEVFKLCGTVRSGGKSNGACMPDRKKWAVVFENIYYGR
ncbi:uncharacterized protein PHACADRAFT_179206 [Phanerochaete carnosa HHB-10118-sp]|uniref:RRM domain-containing protein n=1 Tax=Phanerochaete carnosa (strain HHB-10118-sp) TaxID=650164 RepID=K5UJV5_PHACS|nr:uncharacterized protein PHACADRAFT_179206 [Phanerochaete carnosa HHB-10118-sp]EKM49826.1 hypothetical protein PHACADRAFT_179206 [Phanerochaete carnosa HHB-10118-sp]